MGADNLAIIQLKRGRMEQFYQNSFRIPRDYFRTYYVFCIHLQTWPKLICGSTTVKHLCNDYICITYIAVYVTFLNNAGILLHIATHLFRLIHVFITELYVPA